MCPCLTLSIIWYGWRVKWGNPERGVVPSPTPWCCSYRKRGLWVVWVVAVVWIVSTCPPISKSSRPFNNPLVIVPNAPITVGTIVTVLQLFQFSSKVEVLIFLFTFLQIYSVVRRDSKVDNFPDSLFLLIIIRSSLLARIRWSVCIWKSHRSLCESFSRTDTGLCIYHLFVWLN